jgi:hypothetical protein
MPETSETKSVMVAERPARRARLVARRTEVPRQGTQCPRPSYLGLVRQDDVHPCGLCERCRGDFVQGRVLAATGNEAEIRFAFADTLRMLTNRINIFVSLPLAKLDHLSLQKSLDEIGKTKDAESLATAAE